MLSSRYLWPSAVYALLAGMAYMIQTLDFMPAQIVGLVLFWVFTGCTAVTFLGHMIEMWTGSLFRLHQAKSITPELELASKLAQLDDKRFELYKRMIAADLEHDERYKDTDFIVIDGVPVPMSFVLEDLMRRTDGDSLPPMRTWGEGTSERLWYRTVIDFLVRHGAALPAVGNQAAKVKSWRRALEVLNEEDGK